MPREAGAVELKVKVKVACSYWDESEGYWRMEKRRCRAQMGALHRDFVLTYTTVWNHL